MWNRDWKSYLNLLWLPLPILLNSSYWFDKISFVFVLYLVRFCQQKCPSSPKMRTFSSLPVLPFSGHSRCPGVRFCWFAPISAFFMCIVWNDYSFCANTSTCRRANVFVWAYEENVLFRVLKKHFNKIENICSTEQTLDKDAREEEIIRKLETACTRNKKEREWAKKMTRLEIKESWIFQFQFVWTKHFYAPCYMWICIQWIGLISTGIRKQEVQSSEKNRNTTWQTK